MLDGGVADDWGGASSGLGVGVEESIFVTIWTSCCGRWG